MGGGWVEQAGSVNSCRQNMDPPKPYVLWPGTPSCKSFISTHCVCSDTYFLSCSPCFTSCTPFTISLPLWPVHPPFLGFQSSISCDSPLGIGLPNHKMKVRWINIIVCNCIHIFQNTNRWSGLQKKKVILVKLRYTLWESPDISLKEYIVKAKSPLVPVFHPQSLSFVSPCIICQFISCAFVSFKIIPLVTVWGGPSASTLSCVLCVASYLTIIIIFITLSL